MSELPLPKKREAVNSKGVKEVVTELNFKRVVCKIQDYEIRKGGFLKKDYPIFQVVTELPVKVLKMRVFRTDEDF